MQLADSSQMIITFSHDHIKQKEKLSCINFSKSVNTSLAEIALLPSDVTLYEQFFAQTVMTNHFIENITEKL